MIGSQGSENLSYSTRTHVKLDTAVCIYIVSTPGSRRPENPKMLLGQLAEHRLQRTARNPVHTRWKAKANTRDVLAHEYMCVHTHAFWL